MPSHNCLARQLIHGLRPTAERPEIKSIYKQYLFFILKWFPNVLNIQCRRKKRPKLHNHCGVFFFWMISTYWFKAQGQKAVPLSTSCWLLQYFVTCSSCCKIAYFPQIVTSSSEAQLFLQLLLVSFILEIADRQRVQLAYVMQFRSKIIGIILNLQVGK